VLAIVFFFGTVPLIVAITIGDKPYASGEGHG
jgi:hypothetical protein